MADREAGIVGLPNAGKSTLFNALAGYPHARTAPFPFTTIEPHEVVVALPDEHLEALARQVQPEKVTPATLRVRDIAGLIRGAHRGEGLGNQFLAHIREVDVLWHVIRAFSREDVPHPEGKIDPLRDYEIVQMELIFRDMETVQERIHRLEKRAKGHPDLRPLVERHRNLLSHLEAGKPARTFSRKKDERWLDELHLLTNRPVILVLNTDVENFREIPADLLRWKEHLEGVSRSPVLILNADWEAQISEWLASGDRDSVRDFLEQMGLEEPRINALLRLTRSLLNLVIFYTITGGREVRAWLVPRGTTYREAAEKIHSDFAKHFVRAEVIRIGDFLHLGSEARCREAGRIRIAGPDDPVQEGDIVRILAGI